MTRLLCRNTVRDYDAWWAVFRSHADAHREAGLILEHLWRSKDNSNDVFFVFRVTDRDKAIAFMNAPEAANAAEDSSVVGGEYHFVGSEPGY